MTYVSADIVCDAPAGRIEGSDAYRAFMGPFVQMVTDAHLIAAFGDDETALLMYDTETIRSRARPAPNASRSRTARSPTAASCSIEPRLKPRETRRP